MRCDARHKALISLNPRASVVEQDAKIRFFGTCMKTLILTAIGGGALAAALVFLVPDGLAPPPQMVAGSEPPDLHSGEKPSGSDLTGISMRTDESLEADAKLGHALAAPERAKSTGPRVPTPPSIVRPIAAFDDRSLYVDDLFLRLSSLEKLSRSDVQELNDLPDAISRLGVRAVPAIADFLSSMENFWMDDPAIRRTAHYESFRLALIETLSRIVEPGSTEAMLQTLSMTLDPREISVLAREIGKRASGAHHQEVLSSAREVLGEAVSSNPEEFFQLGHLFGVLQEYDDPGVVTDLEQAFWQTDSAWRSYAMIALSKLPNGAGLESLVEIADEASTNRSNVKRRQEYRLSLQMLAQASRESPEAEAHLLAHAGSGRVDTATFLQLAKTLSGWEQGLISPSSSLAETTKAVTRVDGRAPETWTDTEIEQRIGLIDEMLHMDLDPEAAAALQKAQDRLLVWKSRALHNGKRRTR